MDDFDSDFLGLYLAILVLVVWVGFEIFDWRQTRIRKQAWEDDLRGMDDEETSCVTMSDAQELSEYIRKENRK